MKLLKASFVIVLMFAISGCGVHSETRAISTPTTATVVTGPVNQDPNLPNPALTTGDVLTTDSKVVCVPGYSAKVRNVPESRKRAVFKLYGITYVPGAYEVDHLISLELGGSNDIRNLWPEHSSNPLGSKKKDVVEDYLHRQVCSGAMPLVQAQQEIAQNWLTVYNSLTPRQVARNLSNTVVE